MASGTRLQRVLFAIPLGVVALYCDLGAPQGDRALLQAGLLTFGVFGLLVIELRRTLLRWRQALVGTTLLAAHLYVLQIEWHKFPFESSFSVIILFLLEAAVIGLIYIRACQSLDPEGPFGMTEDEKRIRQRRPRL